MNSENSKTSDAHRPRLNLTGKTDVRRGDNRVVFPHLSIYYTWKNIKKSHKNKKFGIKSMVFLMYSTSDIQKYFEYIIKQHATLTNKPPIQIYINRIQNRVTFNIESGCYLELLMPETMKPLGSTELSIRGTFSPFLSLFLSLIGKPYFNV